MAAEPHVAHAAEGIEALDGSQAQRVALRADLDAVLRKERQAERRLPFGGARDARDLGIDARERRLPFGGARDARDLGIDARAGLGQQPLDPAEDLAQQRVLTGSWSR
jgi:hypothetical protein